MCLKQFKTFPRKLPSFQVVKTVTDAIAVVEEDKVSSLSCVALLLENLQAELFEKELIKRSPVSLADETTFKLKFDSRRSFILGESGIHAAASILDPHVKGRGLKPGELLEGCQVITKVALESVTSELASYRSLEGVYSTPFLWEDVADREAPIGVVLKKRIQMPPKTWWSAFFHGSPLAAAATRILSIVASSAAVERANSTQLRLHSKERNRLTHEHVEKLMKVAVNRRIERCRKRRINEEENEEDQAENEAN